MACFLVPAGEAIVTTIVQTVVEKKEVKSEVQGTEVVKSSFSKKLGWLNKMLCGGSLLLAFEHVWHGEVVPWFPFLTAAAEPEAAMEMLNEMATVGVTMAILVTAVWGIMVAVSYVIEKREQKTLVTEK